MFPFGNGFCTTAPIPPYALGMTTTTINALMAEMDPEEIQAIPRFVDTWLRAGWMDEAEADEWPRHCDAWQAFLGLNHQPPRSH